MFRKSCKMLGQKSHVAGALLTHFWLFSWSTHGLNANGRTIGGGRDGGSRGREEKLCVNFCVINLLRETAFLPWFPIFSRLVACLNNLWFMDNHYPYKLIKSTTQVKHFHEWWVFDEFDEVASVEILFDSSKMNSSKRNYIKLKLLILRACKQ